MGDFLHLRGLKDMMSEICIATVATNIYLEYWMAMVDSAAQHLRCAGRPTFVVFTDRIGEAAEFARRGNLDVNVVAIPPLAWPQATLYRYKLISEHAKEFKSDLVAHMDADMLFRSPVQVSRMKKLAGQGIVVVRHPGYRRPGFRLLPSLYARHPGMALQDLVNYARQGGRGSWETDRRSAAFVPRSLRKCYVAGGAWWGSASAVLAMCTELDSRTRADESSGLIAKWHDESHLNWFAANNPIEIVGSEYCYAEGYANLADIQPVIEAVTKSARTR